jgi:uncharacterized protein YggE
MAPTRTVRLIIAAIVAVGAVAVAGLFVGLRPTAASAPTTTTTSATTPVTVNAVSASPDTLTVVGSGQVNAAPDEASLSLGVSTTRPNPTIALSGVAADMTRLTDALRNQGVAAVDMQTSSVSLGQVTTYPDAGFRYSGSASLTVTIHHLSNVGSIEVAAVAAVGNDLTINGLSLTLSDDSTQLRAARIAAMADARSRGAQWAAQTGRTLGPILAVSEIVNQPSASSCTAGCGAGGSGGSGGGVPIQAGQNTVSVNITVAFQLK